MPFYESIQKIVLHSKDLSRYKELDGLVKKYCCGHVAYFIAATARESLQLILADKTLLALMPHKIERIKFPLDANSFPNSIDLEDILMDSEMVLDSEEIPIVTTACYVLFMAVDLYKTITKETVQRQKNPAAIVEEVFKFGITVLKGLCDLNRKGYRTNLALSNSENSLKKAEQVYFAAGRLLEKINEESWFITSYYMPSFHGKAI